MEHWEFLLQKEGDRSWLPLDSPDVEILEGRYRVVARSKYVNAAIDIRIVHLATEEDPPRRRIQKRSCRTNHDGLMVVIPFTHLEAGQWELCCSPADLMSDLISGAQPYALKLQVVAHSLEEDWDPDWASPDAQPNAASTPAAQRTEPAPSSSTQATNVASYAAITDTAYGDSPAPEPLSSPMPAAQPTSLPPEVAEILAASMDRLFQIAEQMSDQLVDEVLQDFDLTAIADSPAAIPVETDNVIPEPGTITSASSSEPIVGETIKEQPPAGYTLAANETFVLTLDQTTFVATRGAVMTLAGQVSIASAAEPFSRQPLTHTAASPMPTGETGTSDPWESDDSLDLVGATVREIQLCLRDPQSLQVLVSDRQPLRPQTLPYSFTFTFSLPEAFVTHLVLGEVLLCGTLAEHEATSIALVTQAFSITVDPGALVGELAKLNDALTADIEDEERIDLPLELSSRLKEQVTPTLDLSFLDEPVVEPPTERSPRFPSLAGQPLPPQLYRPDPNQIRSKALDLPAFKLFVEPPASPQANHPSVSEQPSTEQPISEAIAANAPVDAITDSAEAANVQLDDVQGGDALLDALANGVGEIASSDVDTNLAADSMTPDTEKASLDLPSPTQMSFQSLKLQDRFLTRLASLATDAELSALLKANLAPGHSSPPPSTPPSLAGERSLTEEIVIDDDPQPTERQRSKAKASEPASDEPPSPLVLPADDPVPTPLLEVTTGELTAGKPINIRVKLPNLLPRIYVKLWVTDRQTRSLLDGPRWLVDFLPNGLGALEAMTPLTVPFGSVELRFEAIAVEMHTQRESYKVTVDRVVVPPDLPSVSLDDFHA